MSKHPLYWFIFTAILIVLGRVPVITAPPWDIDEGLYASVGQALARGELLYRDVWDNKPPAIYFLYDSLGKFSATYTAPRVLATIFLIVTAGVIFYLARKVLTPKKAYVALAFLAVNAIVPIFETHISNAEIFFLLPTSLAILLTTQIEWGKLGRRIYLVVGALLAVGFLFKAVVAFDALAILTLLFFRRGPNFRRSWGYLILGGAAVLIAPAIYLLANNLAADFIRAAFLNNFGYVQAGSKVVLSFIDISNPGITLTGKVIALAGGLVLIYRHYTPKFSAMTLIYLWLAFSLFGALLSGRPYLHYLIASLGALSIVLPDLLGHLWPMRQFLTTSSRHLLRGLTTGAAIVVALVLGFWGHVELVVSTPEFSAAARGYYANSLSFLTGRISQDEYFAFYGPAVTLNFKLRDYLIANSAKRDRIYIWGNAPWVYYLSGREHASRYLTAYQLGFVEEAKKTVLLELTVRPPELIVVTNEPSYFNRSGLISPAFPELDQLLRSNYRFRDKVGQADVFERVILANARTP